MPVNLDNMLLTACKNGQKGVVQAFLKRAGSSWTNGTGREPHLCTMPAPRDPGIL